jgi:hypothetical protein
MIRHRCSVCHHWQESSDHLAGMRVACRECGENLDVPANSTVDSASHQAHAFSNTTVGQDNDGEEEVAERLRDFIPRLLPNSRLGHAVLFGLLLLLALAFACALAWWLAGTTAWTLLMCAVGLPWLVTVVILSLFAVLRRRGRPIPRVSGWIWGLLAVVGVAGAAGLVIAIACRPALIYIDNSTDRDLVLELDGRPWLTAHRSATPIERLRKGSYLVTVRDLTSGALLDEFPIEVQDQHHPYVLNLLGAQVYSRGTAYYGRLPEVMQPETRIKDKWFAANVDYVFEQPPPPAAASATPSTFTLKSAAATSTYLRRGEPKPVMR